MGSFRACNQRIAPVSAAVCARDDLYLSTVDIIAMWLVNLFVRHETCDKCTPYINDLGRARISVVFCRV